MNDFYNNWRCHQPEHACIRRPITSHLQLCITFDKLSLCMCGGLKFKSGSWLNNLICLDAYGVQSIRVPFMPTAMGAQSKYLRGIWLQERSSYAISCFWIWSILLLLASTRGQKQLSTIMVCIVIKKISSLSRKFCQN